MPNDFSRILSAMNTSPRLTVMYVAFGSNAVIRMSGAAKPELSKSPEKISILDIYRAVEGNTPLLHLDTNINPECGIGVNVQLALQTFYEDIQKTTECAMADITLADVIKKYNFLISR